MSKFPELIEVDQAGAYGVRPLPAPDSLQLRVQGRVRVNEVDARIRSVIDVVLDEPRKPQSVKQLAAQLWLSPSRFEHLFKKEVGQSFKAFLRTTRLARAKDLLQDPTLLIKEVAFAVGYRDACDFAHDFRKQYGQSPSQSRRLHEPSAIRRGPDLRTRLTVVVPIAGFTNA